METERNNRNNALKQALGSRMKFEAPSNFTYRMMEQVRLEAARQRKRRKMISWISLITASLLLVGLTVYILVFSMEFNLMDYMPHVKMEQFSPEIISFYGYIGTLVLLLLGLDYRLRKHRRKSADE